MRIITDLHERTYSGEPLCAALGYFDGLHIGHMAIIDKTEKAGMSRAVITFSNQPAAYIAGSIAPQRLMKLSDKTELLAEMGIDYLYMYPFDEEMRNLSAEDFFERVIIANGVKKVVVGFNFNFGKGRSGNAEYLSEMCGKVGIDCEIIAPITDNGEVVSSSLIKKCLYAGDVTRAKRLLGRPFYIRGIVSSGKKLGRTLGFPTANLAVDNDLIVPKWGVYETETEVNGGRYKSVTNIGNNPTIETDNLRFETHIIDFEGDIYGTEIKVEFVRMLREERKFADVEELRAQVLSDIEMVRLGS